MGTVIDHQSSFVLLSQNRTPLIIYLLRIAVVNWTDNAQTVADKLESDESASQSVVFDLNGKADAETNRTQSLFLSFYYHLYYL
jgi:hypothetical protein